MANHSHAVIDVQSLSRRLLDQIDRVMIGKREQASLFLAALLAGRHVLLEDMPGTGKTTLIKCFARSIQARFARIQFTPDLLPSDITGVNIFNMKQEKFQFQEGPLFHHLILADEINRASPKTQSALLECMEERQVTVDGISHPLPQPFLVMATQNPVEYEGTYPLPESQLDRFAIRLRLGYPSQAEEVALLSRFGGTDPLEQLEPVASPEEILAAQAAIQDIHISTAVQDYLVRLIQATRNHPLIQLGASPRCTLALAQLARALAAMDGRSYVFPDDVKLLFPYVVSHRLQLSAEARWQRTMPEDAAEEVLHSIKVPV